MQDDNGEFPIPRRSFSSAELIPADALPTKPKFPPLLRMQGKRAGKWRWGRMKWTLGTVEEGEMPETDDWEAVDKGE